MLAAIAIGLYLAARKSSGSSGSVTSRTPSSAYTAGLTRRYAEDEDSAGIYDQIQTAIKNSQDIGFDYTNQRGERSTRRVSPHTFVRYEYTSRTGSSLCVSGYCHNRKEERSFALRRIRNFYVVNR